MQVELLQQLLLDAGADAIAEQRAVGHDDGGAGGSPWRVGGRLQLPHDELEEQQRGLGGLLVLGEIALDALLLLAAEGRVGEDDIDALLLADLGELEAQGVAGVDLRRVEAMQQQVHLAEQIRQRLRLAAEEALLLQELAVGDGLDLLARWLNASTRNPPVPQAGSSTVSPRCGSVTSTMKRTTARGV